MMTDNKIIGLIDGLSTDNAIKYGSIGISGVSQAPSGIQFNMVNGMNYIYDLSANTTLCYKTTYDTNNNGVIDKSETLIDTTDNTFHDGAYYLDRTNHTGNLEDTIILLSNPIFTDVNRRFTGNTLAEFVQFLDKNKEFISGIFIGDSTEDGNFKVYTKDSKLVFSRRENGTWKDIQSIGSVETDRIILNEDSSSITFLEKDTNRDINVVSKSATTDNGIRFSDIRLEDVFITGDNLYHAKYINNDIHYVDIQTDELEEQSIKEFSVDFIAPAQNDEDIKVIVSDSFVLDNLNTSSSVGMKIIETNTGRIIYSTASDFEINQGLGEPITETGLHTVKLKDVFYFVTGVKYTIRILSKNALNVKGKTIGGKFIPYFRIIYKQCKYTDVLTKEDISDSLSINSSDLVASSKSVYTLNKALQSVVAGESPTVPITCEDFVQLEDGINGSIYLFTNDGSVFGQTIKKKSIAFITNTFEGRIIEESDCTIILAEATPDGSIFVTNIETTTSGKNVSKTLNPYPDDATISSIGTDETNELKVTVVWDRGAEQWCGIPTIEEVPVTGIANVAGGTFTGYANIPITNIEDSITAKYGDTTYLVAVSKVTPPTISSITFGTLPDGQTELKEDDKIEVTIEADKDIKTVEIQDFGAFKNETINVSTVGTTVTISGTIANRGITLQQLTGKLRVKSTDNSWSNIVESTDTLPLNNLYPTITIDNAQYPVGQLALKGTESVVLTYTANNFNDVRTVSTISDLVITDNDGIEVAITRDAGGTITYNDGSNKNIKFTLIRNENGAVTTFDYGVAIVTVPATLTSQSLIPYNVASGVGSVNNTLTFDQKVKIKSISALEVNKGTLTTGTTTTYSETYALGISAQSSDTHSNDVNTTNIIVTGLSGIDSASVPIEYYIRGFSNIILNFTYPELSKAIGTTVADVTKLTVSGKILSSPPLEIAKEYVTPSNITDALADKYSISLDGTQFLLPSAVNGFGYNSTQGIEITISENY